MSIYNWPLGSFYNKDYMDTDQFLQNRRTENGYYSYYKTVTWNVEPGYLPFNYITNHYPDDGLSEEITASGVFTQDGIQINPFFRSYNFSEHFRDIHTLGRRMNNCGEGLRLTKLYYRINDGKWMELSPGIKEVSFDLANNGDKVDIQATYQLWTMGNPHSPVPFIWLGDESGTYNDGKNKFTDAVPVNPGRKYSGIINYHKGKDYNADWQLQSVSWYAPGSTMIESNWAYKNSMDFRNLIHERHGFYLNTWSDRLNCQVYNNDYLNKPFRTYPHHYHLGWHYHFTKYDPFDTYSKWWLSPYRTRKGCWWVYEKTFTDSYVATGISSVPQNAPVTDVSLRVVPKSTCGWHRTHWLDGLNGDIIINFNGPTTAFANIYTKQLVYNEEVETKIMSSVPIRRCKDNKITITFNNYPQLYRSKNIAYYIEIFTSDGNKSKIEYVPDDTSYTALLANGSHYYNDEPPWISNIQIRRILTKSHARRPLPPWDCRHDEWMKRRELYEISWDAPTDPDGDEVDYVFLQDKGNLSDITFSPAEDYAMTYGDHGDWVLRVKRDEEGNNENVTIHHAKPQFYNSCMGKHALFHLDSNSFLYDTKGKFINPMNVWIVPHDGYINNYYYGTRVNLLDIDFKPISIDISEIQNDKGQIILNHSSSFGYSVNVKIHVFMSDRAHDDSTGSYLGVIYEGSIDPGITKIDVTPYTKINGKHKIKRGHYIKYAIQCDSLYQLVCPYDKSIWSRTYEYQNYTDEAHIFNCLPSAVTPFVCEDMNTMFLDKTINISWNKAIDADDDNINYTLYIASINKPTLNTHVEKFWINSDADNCGINKKYYKSISLGSLQPTKDMPYKLSLPEFDNGDDISLWIKADDGKGSLRYITGDTLQLNDLVVNMTINPPKVIVSDAYAIGLTNSKSVDGESGYVKVCQINNYGETATVTLHAMCKKISGPETGDIKLFKDVATWNLKSGEWSVNTKINFITAFGEEWSNSDVVYYAVTTINSNGATSEEEDMMTTSAYDKWTGVHRYNSQPTPFVIRLNSSKTDLHKNAYIEWGYLINEDLSDISDITIIDGAYDNTVPKIFC